MYLFLSDILRNRPVMLQRQLACLGYSLTLNMEAGSSFETPVNFKSLRKITFKRRFASQLIIHTFELTMM
jgi:hypothetical protein